MTATSLDIVFWGPAASEAVRSLSDPLSSSETISWQSPSGAKVSLRLRVDPGQTRDDAAWALHLHGAAGIVFAADSRPAAWWQNTQARADLQRLGASPGVLQLVGQSAPNALPPRTFVALYQREDLPLVAEQAPSMNSILALDTLLQQLLGGPSEFGQVEELEVPATSSKLGTSPAGPAPAPALLTGQVFGTYRLGRLLGSGGMAEVYLGRDLAQGHEVAIKVLRPGANPARRERFRREARLLGTFEHENLVSILDEGSAEGFHYTVLERIEGRTLAELVQAEGPLPPGRAARVVRDVARALGHLHERGVLHRDVKPSNVLLTPAGVVKLIDLGVAKDEGDLLELTQPGRTVGTRGFLAPELTRSNSASPGSDLYSLGLIWYLLVSGTQAEFRLRDSGQRSVPRPPLPQSQLAILQRLLAGRRRARFGSAAELIVQLDHLLPAQAPSTPTSALSEVEPVVAERVWRRATVASAAAVLAAWLLRFAQG